MELQPTLVDGTTFDVPARARRSNRVHENRPSRLKSTAIADWLPAPVLCASIPDGRKVATERAFVWKPAAVMSGSVRSFEKDKERNDVGGRRVFGIHPTYSAW